MTCTFLRETRSSLSFLLLLPLWSIGHPWNALFHLLLRQSVGLFGWGISRRKAAAYTGQHKHRINANYIPTLSGIRTHDPSVRASEDSSCLRPRDHVDRLYERGPHRIFPRAWNAIPVSWYCHAFLVTLLIINGFRMGWIDLLDLHQSWLQFIITVITVIITHKIKTSKSAYPSRC
jgi:hypothetical protein